MIERFADLLIKLGFDPSPREIAEALFLAMHITPGLEPVLAEPSADDPGKVDSPAPPAGTVPQQAKQPIDSPLQPKEGSDKCEGELYLNQPRSTASREGLGARSVRVASAIALPGARGIAKALRPLHRLYPSRTQREFDLGRTIDMMAETELPIPVERAARERWLEAALVVDESETMRVWRPTIREFQTLLERHGAFRDVRVWGMNELAGEPRLYAGLGRVAPPANLRDPRELLDAEGRRVILALSDCHADMWRSGKAFELLARWGQRAPVLLVQLLPQRLWEPTAMPRVDKSLKAEKAGLPNARLRSGQKPGSIPMAVATLEEWAFAPWAQMVAARGKASGRGFLIHHPWPRIEIDRDEQDEAQRERAAFAALPEVEQARARIAEFKAAASVPAFRLAGYLSAVELNFPVMRLVQQAMAPDSRQSHLAEVLLGEIIRPVSESVTNATDPDEILYEFYPGVRELLLDPAQRHTDPRQTLRVAAEISRLIENRMPYASEFRVLLADSSAEAAERVAPGRSAFATISPMVVRQFFGGSALNAPSDPASPPGSHTTDLNHKTVQELHGEAASLLSQGKRVEAELIYRRIIGVLHTDRRAWMGLAEIMRSGHKTEEGLRILLAALRAPSNEVVRVWAAEAIGESKLDSPEFIDALLHALKDPQPTVRAAAAKSLGQIDVADTTIIQAELLKVLLGDKSEVRAAAAESLKCGALGDLVRRYKALREELPFGDERTLKMGQVVTEMRPLVASFQHLRRPLSESDSPGMRLAAVVIFQERPDSRYINWLAKRLEVENAFIGFHAAGALLSCATHLDAAYFDEIRQALAQAKSALTDNPEATDRFKVLEEAERELNSKSMQVAAPFSYLDRQRLVEALLQCDSLSTPESRNLIIQDLHGSIKRRLRVATAAKVQIVELVMTCSQFPGGLQDLLRAVHFYEGDSLAWKHLSEVADELLAGENVREVEPIRFFISYSHKDEIFQNVLVKHLAVLKRSGVIATWHDRELSAAGDWAREIDYNLNSAHVILLLISSDYLASDYCYDIEMSRALERHERGEATVIPIILRSCDWSKAPFSKLQALPADAKPIANWADRDEAYANVVRGIREVAEKIGRRLKTLADSKVESPKRIVDEQPARNLFAELYSSIQIADPEQRAKSLILVAEAMAKEGQTLESRLVFDEASLAVQETKRWVGQRQIDRQIVASRDNAGIDRIELANEVASIFFFNTVTLNASGKQIQRRRLASRQFVEDLAPGVNLEMVEIPGGEFQMGTSHEEKEKVKKEIARYSGNEEWIDFEMSQHEVIVPSFFMGKFAVTQRQWRIVAGWEKVERDLNPHPSHFWDRKDSDDHPVEQISWEDAKEFCSRLSKKTGHEYRLPSEAEWEYACRARTETPFAFGETITHEIVNYDSKYPYGGAKKVKSRSMTLPVSSLGFANAFGLHNMHGNVWEWCEDMWHESYEGAPTDGSAWSSGGDSRFRVLRGGSWYVSGYYCRSAYRVRLQPGARNYTDGFRVVVGARDP